MGAQLRFKSAIDDQLTSIVSQLCNCLDRVMLPLAFLGVFCVLAMIGIVDCMFCRLPIAVLRPLLILCAMYGTVVLFPNGMEWK